MSTGSVEVVYRGIFQKTLAKNICRGIVLAARKEGKIGTAFGRALRMCVSYQLEAEHFTSKVVLGVSPSTVRGFAPATEQFSATPASSTM